MRRLALLVALWVALSRTLFAGWFIVAGEGDLLPEKKPVIFVKAGSEVALYLVIEKEGRYFSNAPRFKMDGKIIAAQPLAKSENMWREIAPVLRPYDNIARHLDPVEYRLKNPTPGDVFQKRFAAADAGTWYFTASRFDERALKTAEPLMREYLGHVVQIVCRRDDSYLGYLSELLRTPFIMGPGVTRSGFHQTDQRVGSDCAEFAIYGQRRLGKAIPYGGPAGAKRYLREIAGGLFQPDSHGIYRNAKGEIVRTGPGGIRPGDILHFGQQVSVFYEDRGKPGCLDADDLCFQSWGNTPHIVTIRKCDFYQFPVRIMRWNP